MKKTLPGLFLASALMLMGCGPDKDDSTLTFVTCADYPPFEYLEKGELTGFDIELAQALAQEMGKKVTFENMPFGSLLASLENGSAHGAISTLTLTPEREKSFDFSDPYYKESISAVFMKGAHVSQRNDLQGKKVACQMGTTTQIWLTSHVPSAQVLTFDNNNQVIEALKAGHADIALLDSAQGVVFSNKNHELAHAVIATSNTGYSIALPKGSPLKGALNQALKHLKEKGTLAALTQKWLG